MNETVVKLSSITKTFRVLTEDGGARIRGGRFYALDGISLELKGQSCSVVAGANGSGKSLLMSIIAGLDDASSGSLEVRGKTGLVFQDADSQILGESAREDVEIGLRAQKLPPARVKEAAFQALFEMGLSEKADFPARGLSGGEKRRLAVAGVCALCADIIILDEPYANLDYEGVIDVNRMVEKLHNNGKTLIILTHELEKCLALCDTLIVLYQGAVAFSGAPSEGLRRDLRQWGVRHPLENARELKDLVWR
jgi:biotin transport system ATP-binding protein